jgi:Fe-S oxidoreductase
VSRVANVDLSAINRCIRCGTCRSVCPVFQEVGWESAGARGRILTAKGIIEGRKIDSSALQSLSTCTTCGVCSEICPAGIDPVGAVEEARGFMSNQGFALPEHSLLKEKVRATGNTFGDLGSRQGWLHSSLSQFKQQPRQGPSAWRKVDYVYFVGCLESYRYPGTSAKAFNLLNRFGVGLLDDERCCGSPLIRTGFDATELIDHNLKQIKVSGAHSVIASCAGCYATLKKYYPADFEVLSISEFLAGKIPDIGLNALDMTVTYHDPCHLGRCNKIYDPPRKVIKAICDLEEMKARRGRSRCCGGGGGVRAGHKDLSMDLARRRLGDVPEGVDCIVTSCPLCVRNLRDAGGKAVDLIDLVDVALKPILDLKPSNKGECSLLRHL